MRKIAELCQDSSQGVFVSGYNTKTPRKIRGFKILGKNTKGGDCALKDTNMLHHIQINYKPRTSIFKALFYWGVK